MMKSPGVMVEGLVHGDSLVDAGPHELAAGVQKQQRDGVPVIARLAPLAVAAGLERTAGVNVGLGCFAPDRSG
ncbi:MAG: hypothetical protein M3Z96_05210 [Pseudomonadota bacterium]|nr:hypothetical protein [Pseudomonadota bacterium]